MERNKYRLHNTTGRAGRGTPLENKYIYWKGKRVPESASLEQKVVSRPKCGTNIGSIHDGRGWQSKYENNTSK